MKLSTFKQIALGSVFVCALTACASKPPATKDATALSLDPSKGPDAQNKKDPSVLPVPQDLDSALRQAETQRKNGDLTAADHTLSQLVLASPDDPRVLGEYGKTLVAQGRSDDALAFLERALELKPGEWTLYSAQGVAYDQKGDYPAAQTAYDRALSLKPGEPTVLSNAALSHMQLGDLDGAEKLLLQASPNGAEYPRIANNLALVRNMKAAKAQDTAIAAAAPAQAAPAQAVLATAKAPASTAATASAAAPPAAIPAAPKVDTATLQPPASPTPVKPQAQPNPPHGVAALQADPSVRMQAVPKDDQAGPKAPPKAVAQKKSPADAKAAQTAMLRPALGEDQP